MVDSSRAGATLARRTVHTYGRVVLAWHVSARDWRARQFAIYGTRLETVPLISGSGISAGPPLGSLSTSAAKKSTVGGNSRRGGPEYDYLQLYFLGHEAARGIINGPKLVNDDNH